MAKRPFTLLLLLLVIPTACTLIFPLSNRSLRTELPDWINLIDVITAPDNRVYVQLDDSKIWRPGDDRVSLEDQIAETVSVSVDGVSIPRKDVIMLVQFSPPIMVYNDAGEEIGSHSDASHIYFFPAELDGSQIATIEVTTSLGETLSYTWTLSEGKIQQ